MRHWQVLYLPLSPASERQQSFGPHKSSQLLQAVQYLCMSLVALVKAHSVRKLFHFSSVIPTITVSTGSFVWAHLTLELCKPKSICCVPPTDAEVVLACFTSRSKVSVGEIGGKKKFPSHGLLFVLLSAHCF